jgi:hypothetical protein
MESLRSLVSAMESNHETHWPNLSQTSLVVVCFFSHARSVEYFLTLGS